MRTMPFRPKPTSLRSVAIGSYSIRKSIAHGVRRHRARRERDGREVARRPVERGVAVRLVERARQRVRVVALVDADGQELPRRAGLVPVAAPRGGTPDQEAVRQPVRRFVSCRRRCTRSDAVVGIWLRLSMVVMRCIVTFGSTTCFMRSAKPFCGLKTRVKTGPDDLGRACRRTGGSPAPRPAGAPGRSR